MTDDRSNHDAVLRLLRLLGDRLEDYLDGDERAFETMGEAIDRAGLSPDDLHAAVLVLRGLGGDGTLSSYAGVDGAPGRHAHRVLSAEERAALSPEAWGYLLRLQRHGSLDAVQLERVLDLLTGSGVRPVGVELAREVAGRVALECDADHETGESLHGDIDLAH
jgi:uncharacterized protein Smg (DUF494 family)